MNSLQRLLGHLDAPAQETIVKPKLPKSVITHDSIDEMELRLSVADSPSFKKATIDNAPVVVPSAEPMPEIDFTTASREEIEEWQAKARADKVKKENAPPYPFWPDLTGDMFYSYHTHDRPSIIEHVDPARALHKRIVPRVTATEEHAESRNITRDDPTMARLATMATMKKLREVVDDELQQQMRETQEFEEERQRAQQAQDALDGMLAEARTLEEEGEEIPQELVDQVEAAVADRDQAVANANAIAADPTPISMTAHQGIQEAAKAGLNAAEAAKGLPSFGSGLGEGEPVYTSPEQALSIAERWANNPDLRKMAELFGRLDKDIRFKRSKRVVGGNEEIVDIQIGDNLARTLPSELAMLGDPDFEDEFLAKFASGELFEFSTVGEEHAGRGPILIVLDGSYSMQGERNIWSRAVAMCLLHIARLEKRDFGCIEFAGGDEATDEWFFEASRPLDGEQIIDMASHFLAGGTVPINGVKRAARVMRESAKFRKADLVIVGDGEAQFGSKDEALRDGLNEMGVRIFAIGVGNEIRDHGSYLHRYAEPNGYVVHVQDFDLTDPNQATAELATHIT